ncbi:hypothetical protein DM01DRAFT_1046171 [Hesseltinella vesiculosa]|uniref:Uncharacterized protein n=1 Tax=Hesseltinella vesiculosa TaxID=101127 RepID=A0A1X2GGY6_9FUNG|nr:hypothetical protein DM01DRAFT_1046171 [Hesseltinella vesiculosa]
MVYVKPPSKSCRPPISDFVKLCLEMKKMILTLAGLIDNPFVLGILVTGRTIHTFVMHRLGQHSYRVCQIGQAEVVCSLKSMGLFPVLFQTILKVKDMAATLAEELEQAALGLAKTESAHDRPSMDDGTPNWKRLKMWLSLSPSLLPFYV